MKTKRIVAILLCVLLIGIAFPTDVFAAEDAAAGMEEVESTEDVTVETESAEAAEEDEPDAALGTPDDSGEDDTDEEVPAVSSDKDAAQDEDGTDADRTAEPEEDTDQNEEDAQSSKDEEIGSPAEPEKASEEDADPDKTVEEKPALPAAPARGARALQQAGEGDHPCSYCGQPGLFMALDERVHGYVCQNVVCPHYRDKAYMYDTERHQKGETASTSPTFHSYKCTICDVVYADEPHSFGEWTDAGDGANHKRTCTICGREETEPLPTYTITVEGGTADKATAKAGETVTITANEPEEGMIFNQWALNDTDVSFQTSDAWQTTFTMPNHDVTIEAVFRNIVINDTLSDVTYTGEAFEPKFSFFGVQVEGAGVLWPGSNYTLSYEDNVNVGEAKVILTVTDNRKGSKTVTFNIKPADISPATVEVDDQMYAGAGLKPAATVTWNGKTLEEGKDYTLSTDGCQVGDRTLTVTGTGNFEGTATGAFKITPCPLTITAENQTCTYNGEIQGEGDTAYEDPAEIADKVSVEGLRKGDILANIILDGQGKNAGDYDLVASNASIVNAAGDNVTDDYVINYETGTLTIEPAKVTITVDSASKAEGDSDPDFTGTVEGLVANGDLGEIEFVRTGSDEAPGTYKGVLTATYTENPNYKVSVVPGDLTIKTICTLRWLDGDGGILQEKTYVEGGSVPTYDGVEPTKEAAAQYAYEFSGWDEGTVEGKTTTYKPLFKETLNHYKVIFVDEDGKTILKAAAEYDYGTPAADIEKPVDPAKEADAQYTYTFAGWSPEITEVTGDATYKATYTAVPIPVKKGTLTFDLAGGTLEGKTGKITIEANVGDTIKLPEAPTREGYTFQYWKGSSYEAGADYKVEGDHTFTAVWEENKAKTYTVTFDANGHGTAPDAQTVEEGQKASKPKDPTAEGYTFGGWFTDKECRNAYSFDTAVTKDIVLYAKWTKNGSSSGESGGPSSASGKMAVKTGDENNVGIWFMVMIASFMVLFLMARKRKELE